MRKILSIACALLLSGLIPAEAQYLEFGIMGGASSYYGELVDAPFPMKQTHLAGGIIARYDNGPFMSYKGSLYYGTVSGDDKTSVLNKERNLSFKSGLFEFSTQLEWNMFGFQPEPQRRGRGKGMAFTPILFAGVSVFKYNPKALYLGEWRELQPLRTEGQGTTAFNSRKKYSLTQIAFPIGAGFKFAASRTISVGFEWGARYALTDYIDDVSTTYVNPDVLLREIGPASAALSDRSVELDFPQHAANTPRGDNRKHDWYMFTGFNVTFIIPAKNLQCFKF
jgi:hypothetical protein